MPLAYVQFDAHNQCSGSTSYEMETLFRLFLLKECHVWDHETALVEYLTKHPDLCDQLGLESVPNQSTLWRSWHHLFTAALQDTVETAARTILIKAQNVSVSVPRKPERQSRRYDTEDTELDPSDQTVLEQAETVTEQVSRVAFPAFSLVCGEGCEIHENAYWDLQTYLGLRENLAANEARAFKAREIASQIGVDEGAVSTALSRLKDRGLVEHKATYWAITDDAERLDGYSGYERATALFNDQLGAEDKDSWREHTPQESHPSVEDE